MISCDSIVENGSIILENLCKNSSSSWHESGSSAYAIYTFNYTKPLIKDHIYYARCKYKYTTSNMKPTWAQIYMQGGMNSYDSRITNPAANTEYTLSGYGVMTSGVSYSLYTAQVYHGPNSSILGAVGYVKEMVVYDVTALRTALQASGQITNEMSSLVSWCNSNLAYKADGVRYDVTSLINNSSKINMHTGSISCSLVECDGMEYYSASDTLRKNTYFDEGSGVLIYNNKGNGTVTHKRVSARYNGSPFYPEHKYVLEIKTNGEASPNCGGFVATHTAAANKIFIERFVAKVPVGYNVTAAYNSQGTDNSVTYLTPRAGTGKWEEYAILYKCGSSGTFSTGGHVYLLPNTGYSATSVTWYLAYVNNCDITSDSSLAYYTALNDKDIIKGNKLYSKYFDTTNLFPNGDGSNVEMPLPSGWTWDYVDVPSESKAKSSIVQSIGAGAGTSIGDKVRINPHCRYKVSMWVKCKADMSSFLVAIHPYVNNTLLNSPMVVYQTGTKTQLKENLVSGATQMKVNSNANWADLSYGVAGFRSNYYASSYNDKGSSHSSTSAGSIKGISGSDTVLFKTAYSGSTISSGTTVVESRSGGWYPYPISKSNLPTNNTWKYVEGYFGANDSTWDGATSSSSWDAIPTETTHIQLALNIYGNDGSVPIKYADIRIEDVSSHDGEKHNNLIQFKKNSNIDISEVKNYLTIEALEDGLTAYLSMHEGQTCEYCINFDKNWKTLRPGESTLSINKGEIISFKGNLTPTSPSGSTSGYIGTFTVSKKYKLIGNCASLTGNETIKFGFAKLFMDSTTLIDASELILPATKLANYCYEDMFNGCTSLTAAPELPATTLADYCYNGMFHGCTRLTTAPSILPATTLAYRCYYSMFRDCPKLTTAPALPATTLAESCYENMFFNCIKLVNAPALPATTLAKSCYHSMFNGCTSLTAAPALPATTLADSCYRGMFYGCTSLITAPTLPATTIADYCYYNMFEGCKSLITAPELPATKLANSCYYSMFWGCTSLTKAPILPALTLLNRCYQYMFADCSKLNYIKMLATTNLNISNTLNQWVSNVSSTGTFVKNTNASGFSTGSSGIPSGWTVQNATS